MSKKLETCEDINTQEERWKLIRSSPGYKVDMWRMCVELIIFTIIGLFLFYWTL